MEQRKIVLDNKHLYQTLGELPNQSSFLLTTTGWSMMPTYLHKITVVKMKKGLPEVFKAGQVFLFIRPDGKLVLHRLVQIKQNGELLMNGDAQNWTELIDQDQVVAYETGYSRKGTNDFCSSESLRNRVWYHIWRCTRKQRPFIFRIWNKIHSLR